METILTDEQNAVIKSTIHNLQYNKEITIAGMAGTGKTTIIKNLTKYLKGVPFIVLAPTGKAANVLRSKHNIDAETIHSTIYNYKGLCLNEDGNEIIDWEQKSAIRNNPKVIIVDEASMVNSDLAYDLRDLGAKIIWVGDHGQLPPVGNDPGIMKNPNYTLSKPFRQENPGLLDYAYHVRFGKIEKKHYENVTQLSGKSIEEIIDTDFDLAICGYNSTRHELNKAYRTKYRLKNIIERGEKMICILNNRKLGIFNGMQFTVKEVLKNNAKFVECIVIYDGEVKERVLKISKIGIGNSNYNKEKVSNEEVMADYSYCITCHKSQGSEWGKVLIINQKSPAWDHQRWLYTAATRAKKELIVIN